ncbi:hypothetical protein THAOC_11492 [Thalassiosira oceanica]|uniref:Uncharacterized protein n=1 Tax=Thalassiosira oceanica TaxID=159749 RepID=K0SR29_THAOC|nr:hypothetical protein THAOC_11492 [Thalassiosira oceanica]|eukprot:EJK67469.1 hypothetical protein THAOC_11492 [Thalassiosira oceanica]
MGALRPRGRGGRPARRGVQRRGMKPRPEDLCALRDLLAGDDGPCAASVPVSAPAPDLDPMGMLDFGGDDGMMPDDRRRRNDARRRRRRNDARLRRRRNDAR